MKVVKKYNKGGKPKKKKVFNPDYKFKYLTPEGQKEAISEGGKVTKRSGGVTVVKFKSGLKAKYKPTKDGTELTTSIKRRKGSKK